MVKIHLGNLPDNCHQETIRDMFQPYGDVSEVSVVRNYAFVHITPDESGDRAVKELNKTKLFGKEISVEFAKKQSGRNENRRESGGGYGYDQRRKSGGPNFAPPPLVGGGGILGASPLLLSTIKQSQNTQMRSDPVIENKPDPDVRVRREVVQVKNVPNAEKYGLTTGYVIHERYYVLPSHPLLNGLNTKDIPLLSETNCVRTLR